MSNSLASMNSDRGNAKPSISLGKVSKAYGTGETRVVALHDVSLEVMPGEVYIEQGSYFTPGPRGKYCWKNTLLISQMPALRQVNRMNLSTATKTWSE